MYRLSKLVPSLFFQICQLEYYLELANGFESDLLFFYLCFGKNSRPVPVKKTTLFEVTDNNVTFKKRKESSIDCRLKRKRKRYCGMNTIQSHLSCSITESCQLSASKTKSIYFISFNIYQCLICLFPLRGKSITLHIYSLARFSCN